MVLRNTLTKREPNLLRSGNARARHKSLPPCSKPLHYSCRSPQLRGVEPLQPVLLLLGKLDPCASVHSQGLLHDRRIHGVDVVEQDPGSAFCGVVVRNLAVVSLPIRLRDVAQAASDVVLQKVARTAVGHDAQGALRPKSSLFKNRASM